MAVGRGAVAENSVLVQFLYCAARKKFAAGGTPHIMAGEALPCGTSRHSAPSTRADRDGSLGRARSARPWSHERPRPALVGVHVGVPPQGRFQDFSDLVVVEVDPVAPATMVGGPRQRRFFGGRALSNHTNLAKMAPKLGPGGGWNLGQVGWAFPPPSFSFF